MGYVRPSHSPKRRVADSLAVADDSTLASSDTTGDDSDEEADAPAEINDVTSDAAFFRLASNDLLASETQDYVPKLIASALIAKAPQRYGFVAPTGRVVRRMIP